MTFPTMFMGVGNLVCMPLALAIGRRPVYLASCLILILGGVLAAYSKDYEMHLGVRMLLGVGAGNSEALVPMMWVKNNLLVANALTIDIQDPGSSLRPRA